MTTSVISDSIRNRFVDAARAVADKSTSSVVLSMTNWGYLDFALNLLESWRRCHVENNLMVAVDQRSVDFFRERRIPSLNFVAFLLDSEWSEASESFGSVGFRSLCNLKAVIVSELVQAGISVLWTDTDIVWLSDPRPVFSSTPVSSSDRSSSQSTPPLQVVEPKEYQFEARIPFHLHQSKALIRKESHEQSSLAAYEMFFQSDDDGICAGFFFARACPASVDYLQRVVAYLNPAIDDQIAMRRMLHSADCPLSAVLLLPRDLFPNGSAFFQHKLPQRRQITPVIVHNNCIIGHDAKKRRFKEFGLWRCEDLGEAETAAADPPRASFTAPSFSHHSSLKGHTEAVSGLAMATDISGAHLTVYSCGYDRSLRVWRGGNEQRFALAHTDYVHLRGGPFSLALSRDSKLLAIGAHDRTASVRAPPIKSGEESAPVLCKGHSSPVNAALFDQDSETGDAVLFSGSDDETAALWDTGSGRRIRLFVGHSGWVSCLSSVPGAKILFTGSSDCTVRAWQVSTARCMQIYRTKAWVRALHSCHLALGSETTTSLVLFAADVSGRLYCWSAKSAELYASWSTTTADNNEEKTNDGINAMAFDSVSNSMIMGLESGRIVAQQVERRASRCTELHRLESPEAIRSLELKGDWLGVGTDNAVIEIFLRTKNEN